MLERGLEMSLIAVVHLEERSAYALSKHQSVDQSALQVAEEETSHRAQSTITALTDRSWEGEAPPQVLRSALDLPRSP